MDEIIRAIAFGGRVKMSAITARAGVERARQIHSASPVATAALGRTMCAASMLGELLKEDEASVTVRINGGGPLGSIIAVADSAGNFRGYIQNPAIDLPLREDGKLDVGVAVGKNGMLTVSRDLGLKEPYIGSTQLVSGEIAEDFTAYFSESEQVGAACGLGVLVNKDLSVLVAGGYLVQLMPGAPVELIDTLEKNIASVGSVTQMLSESGADDMVMKVLSGLDPEILARDPVEYRCYCSRERVLNAVSSIGEDDLEEIRRSRENMTVTCQFCDEVYVFSPEEIEKNIETRRNGGR